MASEGPPPVPRGSPRPLVTPGSGTAGPGPLADLLGIRARSMDSGRARFEVVVRPEHMNPYGVLHGGVVYSLVDTAMGGALVSRLEAGERCATLEIKIHYLAAVTGGGLSAEAWVIDRGRRVAVLEARVTAEDERLVAVAMGSFYIQG